MGDIKYVGMLGGGNETPPVQRYTLAGTVEEGDLVVGAAGADTVAKVLDNSAAVAGLAIEGGVSGETIGVILLTPDVIIRGAFTSGEEPEVLDRAVTITVATGVISIGNTGNAVFTCIGKPNSTEVDVVKTDSVAYTL